jgi:hypothetical protein
MEALMGIRAAKAKLRIPEVPSHERRRVYGSSTSGLSGMAGGFSR